VCLGSDPVGACCGGDKIEVKPLWRVLLKKVSDVKALQRWLRADPVVRRRYEPFVRTICAVYRTEILRREGLSFQGDPNYGFTVGRSHLILKERYIRHHTSGPYRLDLGPSFLQAHATQMLNLGELASRSVADEKDHGAVVGR
jgi:hypothetical protein